MAVNPEQMSPLVLAYVGDAVFELYIRQYLVNKGLSKAKDLHRQAVNYVKATTQAKIIHELEKELSESEQKVVKRGRNAKSGQTPKNTDVVNYRYSTGFESLLGYLYLSQQQQRLEELLVKVPEMVARYSDKPALRSEPK